MSALLEKLEQQASSLSPDERARLAEVLLESLHLSTDHQDAWSSEIARRVTAYERQGTETYAAEAVFAEARSLVR